MTKGPQTPHLCDEAPIALGANRIGIIVCHPRQLDGLGTASGEDRESHAHVEENRTEMRRGSSEAKFVMWEWNLDTNGLRVVARCDFAPPRVVRELGVCRCRYSWIADSDDSSNGMLELTDPKTGKSTSTHLNTSLRVSWGDVQTYKRLTDPCALGVCDAFDIAHGRLNVYIVDPNAIGGRRWELKKNDLESVVGTNIQNAAFVPHSASSTGNIPLLAQVNNGKETVEHFLLLDGRNGSVVYHRLVHDSIDWFVTLPIISPDERYLVYGRHGGGGIEDNRVVVLDITTGALRKTGNVNGSLEYVFVQGFIGNTCAVVSDLSAIWMVDIAGDLRLTRILQLDNGGR